MRLTTVLTLALLLSGPAVAAPNWAAERLETAVASYETGDFASARRHFHRLADHGSAIAETMLGIMYAEGKGVRPRASVAAGYFYRAASRGYGPAQTALSDVYAEGRGVEADVREAYFWARVASVGGDRSAEVEARARAEKLRTLLSSAEVRRVEARLADWRPRAVQRR